MRVSWSSTRMVAIVILLIATSLPAPADAGTAGRVDIPFEGPLVIPGGLHTCVITKQNNVDCYGYSYWGQTEPYFGGDAVAGSAGYVHTCILTDAGNADCWGENKRGQRNDYNGGDALQIDSGNGHNCILRTNGNVYCWGNNWNGQSRGYTGGNAVAVGTGEFHSCALLSNGNTNCWGYNGYGNSNHYRGGDAVAVSGGRYHNCVLTEAGNVNCYGRNSVGQAEGYSGGNAIQIDSGNYHTCALLSTGNVECWGEYADAGYSGGDAVSIGSGWYHACAVLASGNVDCWGYGRYGSAADWSPPGWPPEAPRSLTTEPGIGSIELSWQPPTNPSGTITYDVYRADHAGGKLNLHAGGVATTTYTDTAVTAGQSYLYSIKAKNAYGESDFSNQAFSTFLSAAAGGMTLTKTPTCDPAGPFGAETTCNSPRYGFVESPSNTATGTWEFNVNYGAFDNHDDIDCGALPCKFWFDFELSAQPTGSNYADLAGQLQSIATLEVQGSSGTWSHVADINAKITAPGSGYELHFPEHVLADAQHLGPSSGHYRLSANPQPDGSGPWPLTVNAAQAQLVAPPTLFVHGWHPEPWVDAADYRTGAGWDGAFKSGLLQRSEVAFGQSPYAWSDDQAFADVQINGKNDLQMEAFVLLQSILDVRQDPAPGSSITYNGPVNLVSHSFGGLISRQLVEDTLPTLRVMDGRESTVNPEWSAVFTKLMNEYNEHRDLPTFARGELVENIVMGGTPHRGSHHAEVYISNIDLGTLAATCNTIYVIYSWFTSAKGCEHYYVNDAGKNTISAFSHDAWYRNGVNRNPSLPAGGHSMMADWELLPSSVGNPIVDSLNHEYGVEGTKYFLVAGDSQGTNTDLIVSAKSATYSYNQASCWETLTSWEGNYLVEPDISPPPFDAPLGVPGANHMQMMEMPRLQYDALAFMAGEDRQVCENSPTYPGESSTGRFMALSGSSETSGSAATYEPPMTVETNRSGETYFMQAEWHSAGGELGTLSLHTSSDVAVGLNATLRSPGGATYSFSDGDVTGINWTVHEAGGQYVLGARMDNAMAGTWQAWFNRTEAWPDLAVPTVRFNTQNDIEAYPDTVLVGNATNFYVDIKNSGVPVMGANATFEITDQVGATSTVWALDSGTGADAIANDGQYTAQFTFTEAGTYSYTASVTVAGGTYALSGNAVVMNESLPQPTFAPWAPTNVDAMPGPGDGEITVTWSEPEEDGFSSILGYQVHEVDENGTTTLLADTASQSYVHTGLPRNETRNYAVTAYNAVGGSPLSQSAAGTTWATFDPPEPPGNFTAEAGPDAGMISLAWVAPTVSNGPPVTGYVLERRSSTGENATIALGASLTSYADAGLDWGTEYEYDLAAVNAAGLGNTSSPALATTFDVPGQASNLTAIAERNRVQLEWNAPLDDGGTPIVGYLVYRGLGTLTPLYLAGANETSFTDPVNGGSRYYYQVVAINELGEGPPSEAVDARPYQAFNAVPIAHNGAVSSEGTNATVRLCAPERDESCARSAILDSLDPGTLLDGETLCLEIDMPAYQGPAVACWADTPSVVVDALEPWRDEAIWSPPPDSLASWTIEIQYQADSAYRPCMDYDLSDATVDLGGLTVPALVPLDSRWDDLAEAPDGLAHTSLQIRASGTMPDGQHIEQVVTVPYLGQAAALIEAAADGEGCT